ncbi:MAG: hypothetical protein HWN80_09925 [Candidatus Lokiarchaeota archaeon]|nr:hypothetical protein [Candidatus Lokiarchaeota archaeon]
MEYNDENRERLAVKVAEGWDHKELFSYAVLNLMETYDKSKQAFKVDCKSMGM